MRQMLNVSLSHPCFFSPFLSLEINKLQRAPRSKGILGCTYIPPNKCKLSRCSQDAQKAPVFLFMGGGGGGGAWIGGSSDPAGLLLHSDPRLPERAWGSRCLRNGPITHQSTME